MSHEARLDDVQRAVTDPEYVPDKSEAELNADLTEAILRLHDEKPDRFARLMEEKAETDPLFVAVCYEVVTDPVSHDARLDRLEESIAPDEYKPTPELDQAIEREFDEIRRSFPDKGEEMIAAIIAKCDPSN